MREILFRGKRVDNGKWIYGNFIRNWLNVENSCIDFGDKLYKVIPKTVGQCTGLEDKNGMDIFEGDIITTDLARPYLIVEYHNGAFMFNCNDGGKDYYDIIFPLSDESHTKYNYGEVIGNIHDNPELTGDVEK